MHCYIILNCAVLLQQSGSSRKGVRCCSGSWGDSGCACRHGGVARRQVLTSITVNLHVQKQLVLFNTLVGGRVLDAVAKLRLVAFAACQSDVGKQVQHLAGRRRRGAGRLQPVTPL